MHMQVRHLYVTLPDAIYVGMPISAKIPEGCPGTGETFTFAVQEGWQAGESVMVPLQVIVPSPPPPPARVLTCMLYLLSLKQKWSRPPKFGWQTSDSSWPIE